MGCFGLFFALIASPYKSKSRLEAEKVALKHQLMTLPREVRCRVRLMNSPLLKAVISNSIDVNKFTSRTRTSK